MKKKTINSIISKKFDEWVATIKDQNVKALVDKNTIITGGCIASMLLKEPVNDFDVYFKDEKTAEAVANYYVKQFNGGGNIAVENKNGRIKIFINSNGVAGQMPDNNEEFGDDPSKQEVAQTGDYKPVFLSANAITLSDQIQIVIRFYGDPDTIHQHYDYIHCTNYWVSDERKVTLKHPALEALLSKELVYVGSKYPICSVIRTRKFINRGWTINAGQYLKMCFQISKLDLSDIEVLEDQLTGVDSAYFFQLINGLREHTEKEKEAGKEFKIEYGYLAAIIDKIF